MGVSVNTSPIAAYCCQMVKDKEPFLTGPFRVVNRNLPIEKAESYITQSGQPKYVVAVRITQSADYHRLAMAVMRSLQLKEIRTKEQAVFMVKWPLVWVRLLWGGSGS